MHRASAAIALLCVVCTLGDPPPAHGSPTDPPHVPGELIVGFREGTGAAAQQAVHDRIGARTVRAAPERAVSLVAFDAAEDITAREADYRADPDVLFAHPNYVGRIGFRPDDTAYPQSWHHDNTGQNGGTAGADVESEAGWDVHRGSGAVTVAVLDSGIDSDHPEFAGRIVPGFDFVNNDADPEDDHGHGTEVTGILAANANNGFGVAGVDHFCRILPVKVVDATGAGTTFDLMQGVDYARVSGADVVNMSLIDYPVSAALTTALQAAESAGLVLVACAGNGGIGDADVSGPGLSPHTISVGATNGLDERTSFSGTGSALEFVAPGKDVPTVLYDSAADGSALFSGCSAAAPIVAGIAAILKATDPSLTNATCRALLQAGAEDQVGRPTEDTAGWDPFHGYGRVNLRRTLGATGAVGVPDPVAGAVPIALRVAPNPARGVTTVTYELEREGEVTVSVVDIRGRLVRALETGRRSAGRHTVLWDGRASSGTPSAPGPYFVRIRAGATVRTGRVTLLR